MVASLSNAQARAQPATVSADAARAWGFDRSDLAPHPGVRFGVLPNGMRYALMRNATPAGGLSVRLRFGAGATVESAREQGFMHVIEHLIFGGSANLPQGALALMLPHQGLRRLSDFNAFTDYNETVYRLDLPRADRRARDTAMTVMREIAGNLLFTRRTVENAKAIVRDEIRERNAVQDRVASAQNVFFMPGTPIARGSVTGTDRSVRRADARALRRLYDRYYVPRNATLVVAGDFDPAAVEAEIAARFGDWHATEAIVEADPPAPVIRTDRDMQVRLFVDPAAATAVTVATASPLGGRDAGQRRDAVFLEHLGAEMLSRRLARIATGAQAPFEAAAAAIYDHLATARIATIDAAARDRNWMRALQRTGLELRRALRDGFSQAELDEQLAANQRGLASGAAPRTSLALADELIDAVGRGIVYTAPGNASATGAYLARVRLLDVNAAFRIAWTRPGRLIFISHDRAIAGGEAAIAAVWDKSFSER